MLCQHCEMGMCKPWSTKGTLSTVVNCSTLWNSVHFSGHEKEGKKKSAAVETQHAFTLEGDG